ncbi:MAG: post-COAP-1 domain-containing protein [Gaiellaceae bacterium]
MSIGVQPVAASPGTLVVDDDGMGTVGDCNATTSTFATINAAIAAASPGDTIIVCPGTYNEQVNVDKNNLTLLGAQAGVDARTRPFVPDPSTQSIIQHPCGPVQLTADNLELNGFTIQGSTLPDPCFLAGIWSNPGGTGTNGGFRILYNIVQDNISGIELDSTCAATSTLVQFNLIQNNSLPGPGSGNGIQTNFGLCNAMIDRNKFFGHDSSSFLVVAPSSNLSVTNNELVAGTAERFVLASVDTATISGNLSTGSTGTSTIRLFGGDSNITITSNTLLNGLRGIRVGDPFGIGINTSIVAHQNCIKGNSIAGMEVEPGGYPMTPQLNAENNWWGHPSGPMEVPRNPSGAGDKIIDLDQNVDFMPWLTVPPPAPCPAAPPPPNTPGKVTGGGQIDGDPLFSPLGDLISLPALMPSLSGSNSNSTFGFVAKCCAPSGNLEYNDHGMNVRIKAQSISGLNISSPGSCASTPGSMHATFRGTASVIRPTGTTTEPFTVDVDDCGEPGTSDTFSIKTTTYSAGPTTLIGGNIQIHKS